jgi:hypothetical protein
VFFPHDPLTVSYFTKELKKACNALFMAGVLSSFMYDGLLITALFGATMLMN